MYVDKTEEKFVDNFIFFYIEIILDEIIDFPYN
ncbi:hypothetical protein EV209_2199 [Cuneatibacter caecimuris]|uniref:Uncharacterized protein n=1 Tax=Cuneatibacter caecimuris TaxID=1796618 RepID=A0A4Q7P3Y3_9FIRM|nr:hypothetical protein EV209_2199 [Cuneatibacter caecimuris]